MESTLESRPVILCADDFGLAPGVSDAICGLIAAGRLSATSCMTTLPGWRAHASDLQSVVARAPAENEAGKRISVVAHAGEIAPGAR